MATLIFKLRQVPEDEAEDVRQLLTDHRIDFYETDAGNWGISMPGLWLNSDEDATQAKSLIEQYQQERSIAARSHYESQLLEGKATTLLEKFLQQPLKITGLFLFCAVIVYFSIKPFLTLLG